MPIIANAKKALRQSKTRAARNLVLRAKVRNIIKKVQTDTNMVSQLFSTVDKAVKKNLIHKNKAARIKSRAVKTALQAKTTSLPNKVKKSSKTIKSAKLKTTKIKKK